MTFNEVPTTFNTFTYHRTKIPPALTSEQLQLSTLDAVNGRMLKESALCCRIALLRRSSESNNGRFAHLE
eukprot:8280114-Alexandrium_andersonii.AAC.1